MCLLDDFGGGRTHEPVNQIVYLLMNDRIRPLRSGLRQPIHSSRSEQKSLALKYSGAMKLALVTNVSMPEAMRRKAKHP